MKKRRSCAVGCAPSKARTSAVRWPPRRLFRPRFWRPAHCSGPRVQSCSGGGARSRTGESVRKLSDWNCVTTSPEIGTSPAAETLRARAA